MYKFDAKANKFIINLNLKQNELILKLIFSKHTSKGYSVNWYTSINSKRTENQILKRLSHKKQK